MTECPIYRPESGEFTLIIQKDRREAFLRVRFRQFQIVSAISCHIDPPLLVLTNILNGSLKLFD